MFNNTPKRLFYAVSKYLHLIRSTIFITEYNGYWRCFACLMLLRVGLESADCKPTEDEASSASPQASTGRDDAEYETKL